MLIERNSRLFSSVSTNFSLAIPYPTRAPAKPYILEKVRRMIKLENSLRSCTESGYDSSVTYS